MTGSRGRALFVVPSAFPVGGLATWLDTLLPDLAALGWETWLGIPSGRHSDAGAYLRMHPFPRCVRLENPSGTRLGRRRAVERALDAVRPAVVVAANVVDVFGAVARRRARGLSTPGTAASIHTLDPGLFADLERFAGAVDAVIAPNELVVTAANEIAGLPRDRVFRASYGVAIRDEAPPPWKDDEVLDLLWIGRFEDEQKRVSDLPALLRHLDRAGVSWRLTVAGTGRLEGWLRASLADAEWSRRTTLLGPVLPDVVRDQLLRPGRILLILSRWELGPVVAWEAMGQGVLVISADFVGSGLEGGLVHGETCLLFPVGDIAAAAAAVAAARSSELGTRLVGRAWEVARQRYSRPRAAADWDDALTALHRLGPRQPASEEELPPAGRLDRLLGLSGAEALRRTLRWSVDHRDSGDEWPHTRGTAEAPERFLQRLAALDGRAEGEVR